MRQWGLAIRGWAPIVGNCSWERERCFQWDLGDAADAHPADGKNQLYLLENPCRKWARTVETRVVVQDSTVPYIRAGLTISFCLRKAWLGFWEVDEGRKNCGRKTITRREKGEEHSEENVSSICRLC